MSIQIFNDKIQKHQPNFWNHIHFHPTDAIEDDWGRRILDEVAKDGVAKTVRMYAMLEDIVTRDENGNFVYDFALNDQRIDYMLSKGFNLLLSYNFIPPCIARDPELTSNVTKNATRYKGKMIVTSPPRDYAEWEEICYRYTEHILDRYGEDVVKNWHLQCYNEPDISPFFMKNLLAHGDPELDKKNTLIRAEEYCKLYHGFERGIRKVSKNLCIGGPALAGKEAFLDKFLAYTKENDLQIDYVCYHAYGTGPTALNEGRAKWNIMNNIEKIDSRNAVVRHHYPDIEIVVDEWGMASNGFYNIDECPAFIAREDHTMSVFFAKLVTALIERKADLSKLLICLSGQHEMTQDFSGFRNFFTLNHIKKPIYNAYALMSKLGEDLLEGKTDREHLSVLPTKDGDKTAILLSYATENFDGNLATVTEQVEIHGVSGEKTVTVWRIDETHTNPYGLYCRKGFTKDVTPEQIAILQEEGTLKPAKTFTATPDADGTLSFDIDLHDNGVVLLTF